ncbi:MAG: hypothetical protein ACKN81_18100 [Pirellulaceae bacterium]
MTMHRIQPTSPLAIASSWILSICLAAVWTNLLPLTLPLAAQGTLVREGGEAVVRSLGGYFSRNGGRQLAEELAELGGDAAVGNLARKVMTESGEQGIEQLATLAGKFGPDAVRALQQADSVAPVLKAISDLPEAMVGPALRRLSGASAQKELTEAVSRYGASALRAEVAHPGMGGKLVGSLGNDGIFLAEKLSTEQLLQVARHADDIAKLPTAQRESVLQMMRSDTKAMVSFLGRFVEKNPGTTLFTAAGTGIILAESERILGGDEIVFDKDGNPHLVSKPGTIGRSLDQAADRLLNPILNWILPIVAVAFSIFLAIRLWFIYQRSLLQHRRRDRSRPPAVQAKHLVPPDRAAPVSKAQANRD